MPITLHMIPHHKAPAYKEIISFGTGNTYSLTQNNIVINSGTYKTSVATSTKGDKVSSILYSNTRVADAVAYYVIQTTMIL